MQTGIQQHGTILITGCCQEHFTGYFFRGNFMMKRIAFTGAVLLSSLMSFTVMAAAPLSPEEQAAADVATRQAVFKLLAFNNGIVGGMARGGAFDAAAAKSALDRIEMLSTMIPEVFGKDTRAFKGAKTAASDTIWDGKADLAKMASDLGAAAKAAQATLAAKPNADGAKEVAAAVGPKCGACHDRFRLK
jgi:hypothetical protein